MSSPTELWLEHAATLAGAEERSAWTALHPELGVRENIEKLLSAVLEAIHVDRGRATRLAAAALLLADLTGDPFACGLAFRASAAARYANNEYPGALADYSAALTLFEHAGDETEIGKTLNSALQTLSYLGQYERAIEWSGRARQIFLRDGDELRLARLASNTANIFYRQDRPAEAIKLYEEALAAFRRVGSPGDVAAALSNTAVCRTSLGEFASALACYEEARSYCETHGLKLLVAEADYNIAWLHYLRGDYLHALDLYARTRVHCREAGDFYHLALCDLDESEIRLELNLLVEGGELAERAAASFAKLGMAYEEAKALLNRCLAETRPGNIGKAHGLLAAARSLFLSQNNPVWAALADFEEAVLERRLGHIRQASLLCRKAWRVLAGSPLPGKAALCELLAAQLLLDQGEIVGARETAFAALSRLQASECKSQRIQAYSLLGEIAEAAGREDEALGFWEGARTDIENLRSRLWGENFRISFLKDKVLVYAALARLYLRRGDYTRAFFAIEQAKSRSMAEMLAGPELLPPDGELDECLKNLAADYRRLELLALSSPNDNPPQTVKAHMSALRDRAAKREQDIARRFTVLNSAAAGSQSLSSPVSLEEIRQAIPDKALLVEYYEIRGVFHACVIDGRQIRIIAVAAGAQIRPALRFLQLQVSRMRVGGTAEHRAESSARTAEWHLKELYDALIAPLEKELGGREHLIFVPHGFLHEVPFHALFDGRSFLADRFTVSYAPSAGVLARCAARTATSAGGSLVMGVPDHRTPWIEREARAVAASVPGALLFLGQEATEAVLRAHGPHSRFLHIATHGVFHRSHPLFSGIMLGGSRLSLIDLYRLPLAAEMVTLSGCSTGLNVVTGADELLGLIRGILYAGARSVLASLWDVDDQTTTGFMISLYSLIYAGKTRPQALRQAMLEVRDKYPHPYYWAPFILVGAISDHDK